MKKGSPIQIVIDGDVFRNFRSLEIHQDYDSHHRFTVVQPIYDEDINKALETAYGYLGLKITIRITESFRESNSELGFVGIITDAVMHRKDGAFGEIHIKGYSPTIKMDGGKHSVSFTDFTCRNIVQQVSQEYRFMNEINPKINVKNDVAHPYTVQYNETDYNFLRRLAQKKGKWFFYDGEKLHFGAPESEEIKLVYGQKLQDFHIEMKAVANQFQYIGYEPSTATTEHMSANNIAPRLNGINKIIYNSSKDIFPAHHNQQYPNRIEEGNATRHLHDRSQQEVYASASKMVIVRGISEELGLRIGGIINIKDNAFSASSQGKIQHSAQNYGTYTLTKIVHKYAIDGTYINNFEGIPEDCIIPPNADVMAISKAETQPGIVKDNNDPKKLGRVQVQFPWQRQRDQNTPWIRLVNPHAGGGKGMYFVPEIGEEVLVGFENDNPEKPYVIGAMYNGKASSGYHTEGNDKKVIQTRSGTKVIMNDAESSIFIEDPSGNTWLMDGKGNIHINAPKNMSIKVGENLDITVGGNMTTSVGKNNGLSVGENNTEQIGNNNMVSITNDHKFSSKNYKQTVEENKNVVINGDLNETTASTTHKAKSGDILIQSAGISKILGAVDAKVNKG
jgi:Rhs element Vgr protein